MQILKVLGLLIPLALSGCASGSKWNKAETEQKIVAYHNRTAEFTGAAHFTEAQVVPDETDENKFTGNAKLVDGKTTEFNATLDPGTGEVKELTIIEYSSEYPATR